jgi:hypothetical protein
MTATAHDKQARARRIASTSKARENKRATAQEQALVKAAQAAVPHDRSTLARERERRRYLVGEYTHRVTGSRIRLLDTKAPDGPPNGLAPAIGSGGKSLRYAVQCLDHGTGPMFLGTLREAERAVRQSVSWCRECAALLTARPKVRARNKSLNRP